MSTLDEGTLPGGWQGALEVTRECGRAWVEAGRSVALLAPSVIIPGERNVLINPLHPDFARLEPTEPVPFRFDPRLR